MGGRLLAPEGERKAPCDSRSYMRRMYRVRAFERMAPVADLRDLGKQQRPLRGHLRHILSTSAVCQSAADRIERWDPIPHDGDSSDGGAFACVAMQLPSGCRQIAAIRARDCPGGSCRYRKVVCTYSITRVLAGWLIAGVVAVRAVGTVLPKVGAW